MVDSDPSLPRPMTRPIGDELFLPPEALCSEPYYSVKSDLSSVGLLLFYIATRTNPGLILLVGVIVNRKKYFEQIPTFHGFLPVIIDCIKDRREDRPSAAQLCQRLGQLRQHLLRYLEMIAVYEFSVSNSYSIPPHTIHELSESFSIVQTGGEGLIVQ